MAKNSSLLKIEGTLDRMTFYKNADGHFVRTKGGVSKNKILTDPNFVRTRENMNEFSNVAQMGKLLRNSIGTLLNRAKDSKMSSRLTGVLAQIKKMDLTSERGLRKVGLGISSAEGKLLLKGFDFNAKAPLNQILRIIYTLDPLSGEISLTDFIPIEHLNYPEGATHVSMRVGILALDMENGIYDLKTSPVSNLPISMTTQQVTLTPDSVPTGTGVIFNLFMIEFFQEINGLQYSLRNGAFNVLNITEVQ